MRIFGTLRDNIHMAYRGQPTVDYIAGLIPLYQSEKVLGFRAARSLQDGTLILPHPENEGGLQDAMVVVWWQGDPNRATDVLGSIMATNAVGDYARFHSFGKEEGHATALLAQQLNCGISATSHYANISAAQSHHDRSWEGMF
ncbi:hypothetical protein [Pseudomonas sp.]|uniref:hypothetical protein n=1 Tax=Pseudomonas sp. TaxID=306 RepID=UPI00258E3738|nr:hypothetical protein [Pseudomonas sp.]